MSHTMGDWEAVVRTRETDELGIKSGQAAVCCGGAIIAVVEDTGGTTRDNARLIAAAPDLLEFVQQIFNGIDTGNITIDTPADETLANVLSRGRKALSKATGAA